MSTWQKVMSCFKDYREIILLIHEKPDGDCLGSALALGHHLSSEGYHPVLYHPEPIPVCYDFLPGQDLIKIYREKELPKDRPIIAVDCADPGRILYSLPQDVPIINIDHHSSNSYFGDFNLVNSEAAATGEIIFELLSETQKRISSPIATCLYVALSADTGSFRYSNTTAKTFRIAGELLNLGANIELIRVHLFDRRPLTELLIIKLALAKVQFSLNGKIVWSVLSYPELSAHNLLNTDTESIISLLRSVEGVEAALVFKEIEREKVKISFRSKKVLDVNILANEFGGGGHPRAAGCSLEGNLKELTTKVIRRTESCLRECLVEGGDFFGGCT
ncbi:MAG: DHH family phosphoesterase [Peptococcia bacterium]|jgi:phosphoesterase RecJ-like protein